MKKNHSVLWVAVAILMVVGGYFLFQSSAEKDLSMEGTGPIRLGFIGPLTGDAAAYGDPTQKTYELAKNEINEAGGINGRPIEIVYEDGKCDGTSATTAAQKLVNVDKLKIILGGQCSGETLAAAEITQPSRVLLLSALSSSPDITHAGDLVFRTDASDALEAKIMAEVTTGKLKLMHAAVISENTDAAQALRKTFKDSFTKLGGEIVFDEAYNTGDTDFRSMITKLKVAGADFIYVMPQTSATGELALKQIKEQGLDKQLILSSPFLDDATIAANPALYEGAYLAEADIDETNPKTKHFIDAYKELYGEAPPFTVYMAAAYDSLYLLRDAISATGSTNPETIADYFNTKIKDWDGAIGTFNFDENGDAILELNLVHIQSGKAIRGVER